MKSAFDVVLWFCDRALVHYEYLQPQKLQGLLFLPQAYSALAYTNGKLIPAHFVADEMGPVEPNIYKSLPRDAPVWRGSSSYPPMSRISSRISGAASATIRPST